MPSVAELSAPYGNFMLGPRPGAGVCDVCFDLIGGDSRCHRCARNGGWLDAVVPISYSVAHEQLHHTLASYKRLPADLARRFEVELAAVLWRFVAGHELCLATAAHTPGFDLVTTVPSGRRDRDADHPLGRIVGELVAPTRGRWARLLRPGETEVAPREFSLAKFTAAQQLPGRSVLLVDDTWTTGASARSAAATLKRAGASTVAAVVIGRHLRRDWRDNDRRLQALPQPFHWERCALESPC
ncbi:MAG: phosphoribosyltransferase [Actinomycetota bacterium]|nr:phosphoribosyltransferase [Actinomycetota bacterium]